MKEFLGSAATAILGDFFWMVSVAGCLAWAVAHAPSTAIMVLVAAACPALGAILAGVVTGAIDGLRGSGLARATLSRLLTPAAAMSLGVACVPSLIAVRDHGVAPGFGEVFVLAWALGIVGLGGVTAGAASVAVRACRDRRRELSQ